MFDRRQLWQASKRQTATATLVHVMSTFSGPALMEYNYGDRPPVYLPEFLTFKGGKLYPNDRPGHGVTVDFSSLTQIATAITGTHWSGPSFFGLNERKSASRVAAQ